MKPIRGQALAWLMALTTCILLVNAWIADDAYISFRTVLNVWDGYGLTWNTDERVQAFTHPLWLFLHIVVFGVTREIYYSSIAIGLTCSVLAVAWTLKSGSVRSGWLLVLALMSSRAFVDYSTSGLENPLTHLLIAGFLALIFSSTEFGKTKQLRVGAVLFGMMAINRLDTVLLAGGLFAVLISTVGTAHARSDLSRLLLLALGPLIAWETFSVVYYGFPFPNTAYAKLGTEIPRMEVIGRGVVYLADLARKDPAGAVVLWSGLAAGLWRKGNDRKVAFCAILYLAYVVSIGGDFMSGRFLSGTILIGAVLLARTRLVLPMVSRPVAAGLIVSISLAWNFRSPLRAVAHPETLPDVENEPGRIADEAIYYFLGTGLKFARRGFLHPPYITAFQGALFKNQPERVVVWGTIGLPGFFAGPKRHLVDEFGLSDPLLSRLPRRYEENWRAGHGFRIVPEGYLETLRTGENHFADKNLGRYYAMLHEIVAGPIWSARRLELIAKMNIGAFDHLIDRRAYRLPEIAERTTVIELVPQASSTGTKGVRVLDAYGLDIVFHSLYEELSLSVQGNDEYQIELWDSWNQLYTTKVGPTGSVNMHSYTVAVPKELIGMYTRVRIVPSPGDGQYFMGHLKAAGRRYIFRDKVRAELWNSTKAKQITQ